MASETNTRIELPLVPVAIVLSILAVGGFLFWHFILRETPSPDQPLLTPEAKAYVRHLKLSDVEMKASESYLKQAVVEINGKITNAGDRPLEHVALNCVFYDAYGQVVLRERTGIVRIKTGRLKQGETRSFRLPFDNIPESWNQAMPQLVIAQVLFN